MLIFRNETMKASKQKILIKKIGRNLFLLKKNPYDFVWKKIKNYSRFFLSPHRKIMLHREKTDLNKISQAKDGEGGGRGTEEDEEEIRKGHEIKIRNPSESNYADRG